MSTPQPSAAFTALALVVAVALAVAVSPFASPSPDGLERVARDEGFLDAGRLHALQDGAPVPGYAFPGVESPRLATGAAGLAGTLAVFGVALALGAALRRRRAPKSPAAPRAGPSSA